MPRPAPATPVPAPLATPPASHHRPPGRLAAARATWTNPRARRKLLRNSLIFLLLAGPNVALLLIFTYRPLVLSLYYSTLQWNLGSQVARFVGFDNYIQWFTDPRTPMVMTTTVVFAIATVGGALVIGLALAMALNRKLVGRGLVRTATFAPYVLSGIAVGMLWLYIFDPRYGLLATILGWVGLSSPQWYTGQPWALLMIIIVYLWKHVGYVALIYLAGLQAIPQDVKDAAALDGAGAWRIFRSIILPLLGPVTFFLLITTTLSALQSFDLIRAMTDGGPLRSTTTLMYQIYVEGFQTGRIGYASAAATVLFAILLVITVIQLKYMEKRVHYS